MAVLLEGGLALLLRGRLVVGDVGQVAFLLVAVVALDGAVVNDLFNLKSLIFCSFSLPLTGTRLVQTNIKLFALSTLPKQCHCR